MENNFKSFKRFAELRLQTTAFETSLDLENSHLFHTSLESAYHQFSWTQGTKNRLQNEFKLVAGFLDTFSPNALADRFEGRHFIAMHIALFVAISEFSMFCFAQKDFFPDVGDANQEVSPTPWDDRVPGLWLIDHTAQGGHVEVKHSQQLIPKNPERYVMSQYLAFLMSRFVWLHELAHCFNGHIAFVQNRCIALRLYEISEKLPAVEVTKTLKNPTNSETLKCLEFDADQSAFWASCNIQLSNLENIEGIHNLDKQLRLRLTLFGSYAMTWMFEQFQNYRDSQNGHTHPDPMLRLYNLLQTASSNVLLLDKDLPSLNKNALGQFDVIRKRIPAIYDSKKLEDIIQGNTDFSDLSKYDDARTQQKKMLEEFQFSEKN